MCIRTSSLCMWVQTDRYVPIPKWPGYMQLTHMFLYMHSGSGETSVRGPRKSHSFGVLHTSDGCKYSLIYAHTRLRSGVRIRIYIRMHVYIYIYIYLYAYTYIYIWVHVQLHIQSYMYILTYICIYIYIVICIYAYRQTFLE